MKKKNIIIAIALALVVGTGIAVLSTGKIDPPIQGNATQLISL